MYSELDFQKIKQMREHCANKANTRCSFVLHAIAGIVNQEDPKVIKRLTSEIEHTSVQQIKSIAETDSFFILKIVDRVLEIADKNWFVPTSFLAALLQINTKTLLKYQQYSYGSFTMSIATSPVRKLRNYQPPENLDPPAFGIPHLFNLSFQERLYSPPCGGDSGG